MNKWILPIVLFIISVVIMILAIVVLRKDEFPDIKNRNDCEDKSKLPKSCQDDDKCCAIWQDGVCRKGKKNKDGSCESKSDFMPLLLVVLSLGVFVAFVVYLVKALKK